MSRKIKRVLKFTPNFKRTRLLQVLCSVCFFFKLYLRKQYYVVGNEHRDLRVSPQSCLTLARQAPLSMGL